MTPGFGRAALLGPAPALRGRGGYCPHGAHHTTATSQPGEKTRRPRGLRPREVLPSAPRSRCKGPAGRGPSRRRRQAAAGCGAAAGSCVLGLLPSHHELHGGPGAPLTRGSPLQPARALCPLAAPHKGAAAAGRRTGRGRAPQGWRGARGRYLPFFLPLPRSPLHGAASAVRPPRLRRHAPSSARSSCRQPPRGAQGNYNSRRAPRRKSAAAPRVEAEAVLGPSPNYSSQRAAGPGSGAAG